jgi:hypothetical protein
MSVTSSQELPTVEVIEAERLRYLISGTLPNLLYLNPQQRNIETVKKRKSQTSDHSQPKKKQKITSKPAATRTIEPKTPTKIDAKKHEEKKKIQKPLDFSQKSTFKTPDKAPSQSIESKAKAKTRIAPPIASASSQPSSSLDAFDFNSQKQPKSITTTPKKQSNFTVNTGTLSSQKVRFNIL